MKDPEEGTSLAVTEEHKEQVRNKAKKEGIEPKGLSPPHKKSKAKKPEGSKDSSEDENGPEEKQSAEEMEGQSQEADSSKDANIIKDSEVTDHSVCDQDHPNATLKTISSFLKHLPNMTRAHGNHVIQSAQHSDHKSCLRLAALLFSFAYGTNTRKFRIKTLYTPIEFVIPTDPLPGTFTSADRWSLSLNIVFISLLSLSCQDAIVTQIIFHQNSSHSEGIAYKELCEIQSVPVCVTGHWADWAASQTEKNRLAAMVNNLQKGTGGPVCLYVGSLHFNITEDMRQGIFEPSGKIDNIILMKDSVTSYSRVCPMALEQLNGFERAGQPLRVGQVTKQLDDGTDITFPEGDQELDLGSAGELCSLWSKAEGAGIQLSTIAAAVL
ncbi:putative RNA-binding protein 23 [Sciurus carolinensis]|uniref:RNA-binding protein 23 n=1 Tax=Sciurus carolinensis TaxID=30640 RepID=A0AA41N5G6_SCICA|nr:putative RNA-binding protein 23 [Sciurus carolinensis]